MKAKFTILIIEDDLHITNFLTKVLVAHDYKVLHATTGKEGLCMITSCSPDLALLDLGLPDIDGLEVLKQVRTWSSNPIIVISARTREEDKVIALDAGADDYLTKPFGTSELLARIRTALRHSNKLNVSSKLYKRPYQADGLCIDFSTKIITLHSNPIHLTPVEYKIIAFLSQNSGKVMTYSAIMSHVWGPYTEDDNKILRVNMANIRRKIEVNPAEPHYIFTEIGVGYRMLEDELGF